MNRMYRFLALSLFLPTTLFGQTITTVVGNGYPNYYGDGIASTSAQLYDPFGLEKDGTGNIYFSDAGNNCIRKISSTGIITRIAGGPDDWGFGGDGGPALAALLCFPQGIAVDASGNVYFADQGNNCIRKINNAGTISTIAGTGAIGYSGDGGPASLATLCQPSGVRLDRFGNLFIADSYNGVVRKVTPSGTISTVAGNYALLGTPYIGDGLPATAVVLNQISDIAVDSAGELFICDLVDLRVCKVNNSGLITTVLSDSMIGSFQPHCIYADAAGNLLVSDIGNNQVWKLTTGSTFTAVCGNTAPGFSGDGGPATDAELFAPAGVLWDSAGNIVVADASNNRLRTVSPSGIIETKAGGSMAGTGDGGSALLGEINNPTSVGIDGSGNLYIADASNNKIRKVSATGLITTYAGNGVAGYSGDGGPATDATLNRPFGIAVDNGGNVYFSDVNNSRIRRIDAFGTITTYAGTTNWGYSGDGGPATNCELSSPMGICLDTLGDLYICDRANNVIRMVDSLGFITTIGGNHYCGFSGDGGPATDAELDAPYGVDIDTRGNVYFSDCANHRIRKISPTGIISTIAGTGSAGYSGDGGPATEALLNYPMGVAATKNGNVVIADSYNGRIRSVTPGGILTTIVGDGINGFSGDGGSPIAAKLNNPTGITADPNGNLFISDYRNHRIRFVDFANCVPNPPHGNADLSIFPNPNAGQMNIEFTTTTHVMADARILDMAGKVVSRFKVASNRVYPMEFHHAPGTYLLEVVCGGKVVSQAFVVEK